MYKSIQYLTTTVYMLALSFTAVAQQTGNNGKDSLVNLKWLTKNFTFHAPDTGFIALPDGNGYSNNNLGASIKYITFPGKYAEAKAEFLEEESTETSLLLDVVYQRVNGEESFSLIREEISPDELQYENHISFISVAAFGDVTVCILGAYPKSKDKLLREKYLSAVLTLKEQ